jgi:hypothetical protein
VQIGTSVSIDFLAGLNGVTAGNVVELVTDGAQNVQNIYHCEAPTIGSLATLDGTNNVKDLALSRLTDTTVLAAWNDDTANLGQLAILTAGSPPTMTAVTATSTNDDIQFASSPLSATEVALSYNAGTNGATRIATVSGTNVTLSTASAITMSASIKSATCALTSSNWFVAYADTGGDGMIRTAVSNGTNGPTLGTALDVGSGNNVNYLSLARTSDTTAMLVVQKVNESNGEIAHITGGTTNAPITSSYAALDGTNNCTYITQSPIDSNHTLCAYNNVTTGYGVISVIQANATNAPTVIAKREFTATPNGVSYCALTAHSSNLHTLTYQFGSDVDGYVKTIYVDSNYNLTISDESKLQGTNNVAYNAIAALTPTTAIAAFQGTGSDGFAGTLTLTPTPVISGQLLGIAETSATNGASASVAIGPIVEGTYTSGADYYGSGSGGMGETASPVRVGKAKTTTELVLDLRGAPEAGKQNVWEITAPGAFTWTAPEDGEYEIVFCGGGGGGMGNTTIANAAGGNSGNVVILNNALIASASISGTIGAGGAGASGAGSNGSDSTVIILGNTYTAKGGRASIAAAAGDGSRNRENDSFQNNVLGGCGGTYNNESFGGVTPIIGGSSQTTGSAGKAGSRGGGGTGAAGGQASGAGGSGLIRITLIHGS